MKNPISVEQAELRWTPYVEEKFALCLVIIALATLGLFKNKLTGGEWAMAVGAAQGFYYSIRGWNKNVESKGGQNGTANVAPASVGSPQ